METSKKAIITGSSKGLGFAMADLLASEGYDITITSRDNDRMEKVRSELAEKYPEIEVLGFTIDFSNGKEVDQFLDSLLRKWEHIDVLINNVGLFQMDRITDNLPNRLSNILEVNLMSAVRVGNRVIPMMRKQRSGNIFNVISVAARDLRDDSASYSISKLALKGYNDLLREELKKDGIKVTALYPGAMDTSSWDSDDPNRKKLIRMEDMRKLVLAVLNTSKNAMVEEIMIDLVEPL